MMTEEIVKNIVNKVYPKIKADYGLSRYYDFPNVEIHRNIYERVSDIKGMEGEGNAQSEYCRYGNSIYVYQSEIKNTKHVIQCLLHEYRHYLQSETWYKRYYCKYFSYFVC